MAVIKGQKNSQNKQTPVSADTGIYLMMMVMVMVMMSGGVFTGAALRLVAMLARLFQLDGGVANAVFL